MPKEPSDVKDTRPRLVKQSSDDAKWEQANAYLKSKDLDLAKKTLTELTDYQNSYTKKATKLLRDIKLDPNPK